MSRIGKKAIKVADAVTVTIGEGNLVTVKGPKGELTQKFSEEFDIKLENGELTVKSHKPSQKAMYGTTTALLHNMVQGVFEGFSKTLLITGVGYRANLQGSKLVLNLGYSHLIEMPVPEGITVMVKTPTELTVSGVDKQKVGQFAAEIREKRKPEPYLGKGIRYSDEVIIRKEGKVAK